MSKFIKIQDVIIRKSDILHLYYEDSKLIVKTISNYDDYEFIYYDFYDFMSELNNNFLKNCNDKYCNLYKINDTEYININSVHSVRINKYDELDSSYLLKITWIDKSSISYPILEYNDINKILDEIMEEL